MPDTTRGYPYPDLSDVADLPAALQDALEAVDTDVGALEAGGVLALGSDVTRFGAGGDLFSDIAARAQFRGNYNAATNRLIDTAKPGWIIAIGDSSGAADSFAVLRAPATAGAPAFALLGTISSAGLADFVGGVTGKAVGSFSAYRNAALSLATMAEVVFDTEEWDVSSWFDTATGRFTPQVAGYYRLDALLATDAALTADKRWRVDLRKNGLVAKYLGISHQRGALPIWAGGSALMVANGTTDYFSVELNHDNGGSVALTPGVQTCYFQGELVGRT